MKVGIVEKGNVSKLRIFLDTVGSHVRALSNQGVNNKHFGAILIWIIQQQISYNIRVKLSQKTGKGNWKLEQFYKLLRFEIEARDSSETAGNTSRKSKQEKPLTLQTLVSALEEKFEQKNKSQFLKQKGKGSLFF